MQPAHMDIALLQGFDTERERRRCHHRKTFRHRCHGGGKCRADHLKEADAAQPADAQYGAARRENGPDEARAKRAELALHRGFGRRR